MIPLALSEYETAEIPAASEQVQCLVRRLSKIETFKNENAVE